jgi:Zn-dependent M28 family amino/carboxypeptidase
MNTGWRAGWRGWIRIVLATSFLALIPSACNSIDAPSDRPYTATLESLSGARIRNHIEVLAADDMQGREAGTAGHLKAAEYVASQFAEIGLNPLGDRSTYFQNIDFLETRLVEGSASMVLHRGKIDRSLEFGKDFVVYGGFGGAEDSVTAPLVFVGFGIQAAEYNHDDFAGVDVNGRILVEFTGAPPQFANDERAYYSSGTGKQALAIELGAIGIVTIRTPVDQQRLTWPRVLASAASPGMRWLEADRAPHDGFPELSGNAMLSESGAEQLFQLAGRDLGELFEHHADGGGAGSFELGVSVTVSHQSAQRHTSSPNVLALLRGSDQKLRNEYVLFTAHLDHLGVRASDNGDDINNGAYDNAAGVAIVIEVAGALASLSPAPRRSVIFAAVTAEEKGLRGSDFLAHNPPAAIGDIVANINIDMPYLGYPIADVEGFGVNHSTLHNALIRATEELGIALSPDEHPELVRLIRSDQFSFVQQGIPGLNLKPGSNSSDPDIDGSELRGTFLREHYHGPSDDLDLPFSEEGAERFVRVAFLLGLIVANDEQPPKWQDGDFFGERYAQDHRD